MTACWMSVWTLIFPSPHGTTTRVLPKHTVTFMVLVSEILPRFGVKPRRGGGGREIREKIKKGAWVWVCSAPRMSQYSFPKERTRGLSAAPRRTTLFSVCFQTTCLASLPLSQSLSLSFLRSLGHNPLSLSAELMLGHVLRSRAIGNAGIQT